jgi:hypothetical protein
MRILPSFILLGIAMLALPRMGEAQSPSTVSNPGDEVGAPDHGREVSPAGEGPSPEEQLVRLQKNIEALRAEQAVVQAAVQPDDKLKKQFDLLQKQIETQQKMIELLLDHVKKQPLAGTPVEKLQGQVATVQARSKQAAQRDQELSQALDNVVEQRDADQRNGPQLPAPLKELFLPSGTNESPLSIYGTLATGYTHFEGRHGNFEFPDFAPFFLLQLNDRFLLEAEIEFGAEEVEVSQAQVDFIANDWLTVVAGRFLVPVGFFNERLHANWINKLPDFPLIFRQVTPVSDLSLNGVQLRGAKYLGCWPVKLEYALFFANGLRLPETEAPELAELATLDELKETSRELTNVWASGGRLGIWLPEIGLVAGISGFFNGPYTAVVFEEDPPRRANDDFQVLQVDAGYHKGNWDVRFEYAHMFQDARSFIGERIERRGLYAQVAYRPYHAQCKYVQNTEPVFRFSSARFKGIDPAGLDIGAFASPLDVPVDRDQYTFGVNYYFYPSLVLKLAYEFNHERGIDLKDNVFLAQLAWGF